MPCNDLDRSEAFYNRLGFRRAEDDDDPDSEYRMLTDADGAEIHLTDAVEGWVVPGRNPFGLYLYTRDVDGGRGPHARRHRRGLAGARAQGVGDVRVRALRPRRGARTGRVAEPPASDG